MKRRSFMQILAGIGSLVPVFKATAVGKTEGMVETIGFVQTYSDPSQWYEGYDSFTIVASQDTVEREKLNDTDRWE